MQFYKIMFFNTLVLGTLISISSYSWFTIWMGLELNLLSFIPLLHKNNPLSCEAALKYFIIQALSSMVVIFSFSMSFLFNEFFITQEVYLFLMNSALLMKMGMAPFHFWFPEIMEGLNWMNSAILLTWQKIAPSVILMYNIKFTSFFFMIMIIGLFVSGFQSWNQTSLKKIMVYSSINHMSWMMALMISNQGLWFMYFLIYSILNISVILFFKKFEINDLNKLMLFLNSNKNTKITFILSFFSLGGIPPFVGFFPKWIALSMMLKENLVLLSFFMVIVTLLMIYVYIRLTIQTLMMLTAEKKNYSLELLSFPLWVANFLNLTGLLLLTLIFNYF